MRSVFGLAISLAVLLACLSQSLPAQTITGTISGEVTDTSGAVVPGATITVENLGTSQKRTAATTASGTFIVPDLAIGKYKVTATAEGFKTLTQTAEVLTGAVTRTAFKLPVGQRTEMVEVEGSAPLVDLSPNNNNYVDSEKIENVPINGRDFNSLIAITPGVQRAPGGGFLAISINGARVTSNNYFIDGLYNNDRYYGDAAIGQPGVVGIPAILFPPEAIEELSVQETPSAEFGVKGGAPILLNMKSGTNEWHGSGTWVNHNGYGDAINYFGKSNGCGQPGECQATSIHNNQMNGTIGGPIIKDRAFLFLYYEGQRYKSSSVSERPVPSTSDVSAALADIAATGQTVDPVGQTLLNYFPITASGNYVTSTPTTATLDSFGTKFDYKFSSSNSIAVRYLFGDSVQSAPPFAGLPPAPGIQPDLFNSVADSRVQLLGFSWVKGFGASKILESRFGYTRFSQLLGINNKINPQSLGIDTGPLSPADFGVPYVYMYHLGYGGYIGGVQGYPLSTRPDATYDWSEHFSWVKGNHTIKIGGNFQRAVTNSLRNNARTGLTLGYFSYYASVLGGVADDVLQLLLGKADLADRSFGNTQRYITQNSVGFYAQDDWKVRPNFTLNFGMRYEINGTMRDKDNLEAVFVPGAAVPLQQVGHGINGIHNVDYRDFAPHLGFSWDIRGNGKTALRGGYSLTYDVPNFAAFADPYSFAHASTGVFTQANLNYSNVSISSQVVNPPDQTDYNLDSGCLDPNTQVGQYVCFDSSRLGAPLYGAITTGTPPNNAFAIVSNFKTPRYHNISLSLQQQVARNNVLTVGYSGQRGQDLLIYHDLNASPIGTIDPSTGAACLNNACDPFRPLSSVFVDPTTGNPLFRHVIQATNASSSQYDSLQTSFNQRGWHGFDTEYNLTWSKCYDYNSSNRGGAGDYPQINNFNPVGSTALAVANYQESRGLCDHDVRLNFNVSGVYEVPAIHALGKRLGDGWQLSTIFTAISGRPFSPILGAFDTSGQGLDGNSLRPAWDGTPIQYNNRNANTYITEKYSDGTAPDPCNPGFTLAAGQPLSPFYFPCNGSVGNARRNQLIGPGLAQWDMTLAKNTKITERVDVELRWEVYNLLNRGNFYYAPNNVLTTCSLVVGTTCESASGGNFGQITKTSDVAVGNPVIAQGGPRNMNFSLKFTF